MELWSVEMQSTSDILKLYDFNYTQLYHSTMPIIV